MSSISLKWQDLDNYILVIAGLIAAIAYAVSDVTVSFLVLATGLLLKAIASAIDPTVSWVENLDNLALGIAGVLAILTTLTNNTTWALYIMIAGVFIKTIASAWARGLDAATNIDNILAAVGTAISGAAIALGQPQIATVGVLVSSLVKGLLSTYFRNKATAEHIPTPAPPVTPAPPAPVSVV